MPCTGDSGSGWMASPLPHSGRRSSLHVVPSARESMLKSRALRAHASQVSTLIESSARKRSTAGGSTSSSGARPPLNGAQPRTGRQHGSSAEQPLAAPRCGGSRRVRRRAATAMRCSPLQVTTSHWWIAVRFPSDTLSTHAIARSGVVQLHRWRLLSAVLDAGTPPIREVVFHGGGTSVTTIKDRLGVDMLVAPRRYVLDASLIDAAVSAGVQLMTGVTVDSVRRRFDGRVTGVRGRSNNLGEIDINAQSVVGADGRDSRVAAVNVSFTEVRGVGDSATHYAYFAGDWSPMEYHLGDRMFAGVFPTNDGEACLLVCSLADEALRLPVARTTRSTRHSTRSSPQPRPIWPSASATRPAGPRHGGSSGCRTTCVILWGQVGRWSATPAITARRDHRSRHQRRLPRRRTVGDRTGSHPPSEGRPTRRPRRPPIFTQPATNKLRDLFEITCELATYPPVERFIDLQRQLGIAIDAQANILAARPLPAFAVA